MDEARCDKLRMFTSSLPTETPARAEHAPAGTTPPSAVAVSPALKYLIKELTDAQTNKDSGTSKAATQPSRGKFSMREKVSTTPQERLLLL